MSQGKKHIPTEENRKNIVKWASEFVPTDDIRILLGIGSLSTLYKYYKKELDLGQAMCKIEIGGQLMQLIRERNVPAVIFAGKTKLGLRETAEAVDETSIPKYSVTTSAKPARYNEPSRSTGTDGD
jgi:hypothetical protein